MTLPTVGEPAPDFVLPGPYGDLIRLSNFRGRSHIVLVFYPFDFSPVCTRQLTLIQENIDRFNALGAEVLGISADSPLSHDAFAEALDLDILLLSDFFGKSVSETYGVLRREGICERATFIIDKDGIIRYAAVHDINKPPDIEALFGVLESLNEVYV